MEVESKEIEFEDTTFEQRRNMILEGFARGERAILKGNVLSHEEFRKSLGQWLEPE